MKRLYFQKLKKMENKDEIIYQYDKLDEIDKILNNVYKKLHKIT